MNDTPQKIDQRTVAKAFLCRLEHYLNEHLPTAEVMGLDVENVVKRAKASTDQRQSAFPEGAVLNKYIAPNIGAFLATEIEGGVEAAQKAFLSESYRRLPLLASHTPARSARHPFSKVIGVKPQEIVAQWRGLRRGAALTQSCPDFAIRNPAPHKIVFEAKYFRKGGVQRAESELVTGIYQAFFYRGLPPVAPEKGRPAWDYDYGCLMICDASEHGSVSEAWRTRIPAAVRDACWEAGNVYVMVLRGLSTQTQL